SRLVMLFLFGEPRCLRAQGKRCMGGKRDAGAFSREKFVVTGGGNHGRVVRGEGRGREEHLESSTPFGETLAEQGIAGYPPGDEDVVNTGVLRRRKGALHQVLHHGM